MGSFTLAKPLDWEPLSESRSGLFRAISDLREVNRLDRTITTHEEALEAAETLSRVDRSSSS